MKAPYGPIFSPLEAMYKVSSIKKVPDKTDEPKTFYRLPHRPDYGSLFFSPYICDFTADFPGVPKRLQKCV